MHFKNLCSENNVFPVLDFSIFCGLTVVRVETLHCIFRFIPDDYILWYYILCHILRQDSLEVNWSVLSGSFLVIILLNKQIHGPSVILHIINYSAQALIIHTGDYNLSNFLACAQLF